MEEDSTTVAASDQTDTSADSVATTDDQTTDNGDNLDTSTSTDDTSGASDDSSTDDTTTDDNSSDEVTHAKQFDSDLAEWAEKTGRKVPETDEDRALLQEIRDGQREYSRSKQAKDVTKDIDKGIKDIAPPKDDTEYEDPLEKRTNALEAQLAESEALRLRSEYVSENNVTLEESNVMATILREKVEKAAAVSQEKGRAAFEYWTDPANLEDWHALAKARLLATGGTSSEEIAAEAARQEREKIARESKANGPARNATQTQTAAKTEDQKRLERFSNWD